MAGSFGECDVWRQLELHSRAAPARGTPQWVGRGLSAHAIGRLEVVARVSDQCIVRRMVHGLHGDQLGFEKRRVLVDVFDEFELRSARPGDDELVGLRENARNVVEKVLGVRGVLVRGGATLRMAMYVR